MKLVVCADGIHVPPLDPPQMSVNRSGFQHVAKRAVCGFQHVGIDFNMLESQEHAQICIPTCSFVFEHVRLYSRATPYSHKTKFPHIWPKVHTDRGGSTHCVQELSVSYRSVGSPTTRSKRTFPHLSCIVLPPSPPHNIYLAIAYE